MLFKSSLKVSLTGIAKIVAYFRQAFFSIGQKTFCFFQFAAIDIGTRIDSELGFEHFGYIGSAAVNLCGNIVHMNRFIRMTSDIIHAGVVFGVSESLDETRGVSEAYAKPERTEKAFECAQKYNFGKYNSLSVTTPDKKINHIMNQWLKKQIDCCIVGKKGVRDNLQIAVALLNYRQDKAKDEILECLRHQFQDGHAVLTWYPYDDTRYSDQPFWIIWAVCELIKEMGDYTILQKKIEWQDGGAAAVVEHLKAAADCLIRDKGRNGLSRIYFADWNDALNITTDPEAESVMLSHQFCLAFRELKLLMEKIGETDYAEFLKKEYDTMRKTINEKAWDGEWYMRALSKKENIGSRTSEGSKIYLNAQTWAVLGDVVDEEKLPKLLTAVDSMEHDFGFPLNMPPYEKYSSTQSGAEPYVFTNCYSTHPKYYGKSYWSWTTGTSAWCMNGLYEGIMGVKRRYDGLEISPCFPAEWNRAEMTRHFRNADYHIIIENPQHIESGKPIVSVDGVQIEGNRLPDFADGSRHEVKVVLR